MKKLLFIFMRGLVLTVRYFRSNLLSTAALTTLFTVLTTLYALMGTASWFAESAAAFDKIRVYHDQSANSDVTNLKKALEAVEGVSSVTFYSGADTQKFLSANADIITGIDSLPPEFFPSFFEVKVAPGLAGAENLAGTAAALSALSGVDSVSYGKQWAERMAEGKKAVSGILFICVCFFIFTALVIIYQTVNITMYHYRSEIRVYSVVGGTPFFITLPFMVMAALTGFVCALLSLLLYGLIRLFFLLPLAGALGVDFSLPSGYTPLFAGLCLLTAGLAGFASAVSFLKKAYFING